jgi:Na+/H+-dicarboxylate symporter
MKKVLKNYRSFVILIGGIILGIIAGIIFKERVTFLKPFGDLFLNLLLTIIVPLIFLTISTSIGKLKIIQVQR